MGDNLNLFSPTLKREPDCHERILEASLSTSEKLFSVAAAETFTRIRTDWERAPRRLKPLLEYLEGHLGDPQLDYQLLKRTLKIRDNNLPTHFHRAFGLPPAAYIRDCRMEIAWKLLSQSKLKVGVIAKLVGYTSIQTFGRAFRAWSGVSPMAFRRRLRRSAESGLTWAKSASLARRAAACELEAPEVEELVRWLFQAYPQSESKVPSLAPAV